MHQYPEQAPEQKRSRQYHYDKAGRLTDYTTAQGDQHGYEYGPLMRPLAYHRPDGHKVQYQYDLSERLTAITRADGQQWQLGWNAQGHIDRCAAPDGRDIRFQYNTAGHITHREYPGFWAQRTERDPAGRVLTQTSQGKDRKAVTRQYRYDAFGCRTHASCADRKLHWAYNTLGQITEHHQDQYKTAYGYGPGGRIETIQLPDGTIAHYHYDPQGRWHTLSVNGDTLIERTFDSQNRETTRTAGSNTQSQLHDRYGCLIKRKWQGQQSATRRYRWDAENRLEATEDSLTGSTHYQRDSQGQLIRENDTEYHYDLGGNRVTEGGQIEQDRLIRSGDKKRIYDALGAEVRVTGHSTEHRTFDAEGQLIEFKQPELHITYGYDALGRRAWRKTDAGTTTYLWHNDVLLGEQSPKGDWQWYLRDPQTDEPLITLIDDQPYYYELDHRMMPVRLWDQDGQKIWEGNSDAWGNCQADTLNHGIHQPLRLPGQFEDELTGIVQNRFRDYDPATGRYLTPDSYGLKGGLNGYRYTPNPVDYVDPLGLDFKPCVTSSNADKADMAPISEDVPEAQEVAAEEGFGAFFLGGAREFLHDTLVSAHSYMTGLTPEEIGNPMGLSPSSGAQAAGSQAYKDNALAINLATAFIPGRQQKVARDLADKIDGVTTGGTSNKLFNLNAKAAKDVKNVTAPIDFDGHILSGELKRNGSVVGGHSIASGNVRVIPGTQSAPNAQGVYTAKILDSSNKCSTTCFQSA